MKLNEITTAITVSLPVCEFVLLHLKNAPVKIAFGFRGVHDQIVLHAFDQTLCYYPSIRRNDSYQSSNTEESRKLIEFEIYVEVSAITHLL